MVGKSNPEKSATVPCSSETLTINDTELCVHTWLPSSLRSNSSNSSSPLQPPRALVVIYHGFLAHGRYPTVRYAAERLAWQDNANCMVIAVDARGHGQSSGLAGYLSSPDVLIADGVAVARHAVEQFQKTVYGFKHDDNQSRNESNTTTPSSIGLTETESMLTPSTPRLFLLGSSMGGAIALAVAHELSKQKQAAAAASGASTSDARSAIMIPEVTGVVMLAPMLRLAVHPVAHALLGLLSAVVPTWSIIPSASNNAAQQYRDPIKCRECEMDLMQKQQQCQEPEQEQEDGGNPAPTSIPTKPSTTIRVASAWTCVELTHRLQVHFANIAVPMLIQIAEQDTLVDNQGAYELYQQAATASTDKTLKSYPALHGLLCEPSPLVDTIELDMVEWIVERC